MRLLKQMIHMLLIISGILACIGKKRYVQKTIAASILILTLTACSQQSVKEVDTSKAVTEQSVQETSEPEDAAEESENAAEEAVGSVEEDAAESTSVPQEVSTETQITIADIPEYAGNIFVHINDGNPSFTDQEKGCTDSFESYSELDDMGRVGIAMACLSADTMPEDGEERDSISFVEPTGWVQAEYEFVSGKYLYNRSHLIGWQLSAENANEKNLITGTKSFNVDGMLPFENLVADYIKETNNHVMYRVTPVFAGDNLLAQGVQIEAWSVEDAGEGICFNVFVYNVEDGVSIDYTTGESTADGTENSDSQEGETSVVVVPESTEAGEDLVWVPVNGGTKYHTNAGCSNMKDPIQVTKETAEANGYEPCKKCY